MANKQKVELVTVFSGDTAKLNRSIQEIQNNLDKVKLPEGMGKGFNKTFSELANSIKDFEDKVANGLTEKSDLTALEKNAKKIQGLYRKLLIQSKELGDAASKDLKNLLPNDFLEQVKKANSSLSKYKETFSSSNKQIKSQQLAINKLTKEQLNLQNKLNEKIDKRNSLLSNEELSQKQALKKEAVKNRKDANNELKKLEAEMNRRASMGYKLEGRTGNRFMKTKGKEFNEEGQLSNEQLNAELESTRKAIAKYSEEITKLISEINGQKDTQIETLDAGISNDAESLKNKTEELKAANNELKNLQNTSDSAFSAMKEDIEKITGLDLSGVENTKDGLEQIKQAVSGLEKDKIESLRERFDPLARSVENTEDAMEGLGRTTNKTANTFDELVAKENDVNNLKKRVAEFFSLTSAVYLFRDAVRSAYQSVSELDAAMTETAVVTDMTVGDMWDQLPKYTETANRLGVATLGAYETMTLFYQQGLKTNEAFALGEEAMKMARIGNLDYADSTNKMTAALRGFNMELNQVSAQRVNDVYSKLAAITAADTNEIATAMTKTASIANSANMEFETTAAFLSQIIETTREAPETAGTAVKTVIARFQELKKAPNEIGEVEGEIVDANKIETALKSVGVSLRDSTGQFRALDDVFLELSERWQTMDTNTQRYIATIAAGSRQQSRFIAMMSDYDRTMELVSAANNSAGASQKQYEKTLDSLESKVERLKNAWQQFTMGLANSSLIKGGIDLLTTLLNTINKLTAGFNGLSGTFLKIGALVYGRKVGKALMGGLSAAFDQKMMGLSSILGNNEKNTKDAKDIGESLGKTFIESFKASMSNKAFSLKDVFSKVKEQFKFEPESFNTVAIGGMKSFENNESYATKQARFLELLSKEADYNKANTIQQVAFNQAVRNGLPVKEASNLLTKQGAIFTGQVRVATILSTLAAKLETKGIIANTAAKKMNAVATKILTMGSIKAALALTGIGVALAAVTIGVHQLYKYIKENSLTEQMKKAEEATEGAQQAVEKTTTAFRELKDTIDSLDNDKTVLEGLAKGSEAWKEQLSKVNDEMLQLVELYPELGKYLGASGGQYYWTDEGAALEEMQEQANQNKLNAQYSLTANKQSENELLIEKVSREVKFKTGRTVSETTATGVSDYEEAISLSTKQIEALAKEYANNPALKVDAAKAEELGIPPEVFDHIGDIKDELFPLLDAITANTAAIEARTNSLTYEELSKRDDFEGSENKDYIEQYVKWATRDDSEDKDYNKKLDKYSNDDELLKFLNEKYDIANYANGEISFKNGKAVLSYYDDETQAQATQVLGSKEILAQQAAKEDYIQSLDLALTEEKAQKQVETALALLGTTPVEATPDQWANARTMSAEAVGKGVTLGSNGVSDGQTIGLGMLSMDQLLALVRDADNVLAPSAEAEITARRNNLADSNEKYINDHTRDATELQKTLEETETSAEAFEAMKKKIVEANEGLKDQDDLVQEIAKDTLELQKALDDAGKIIADNEEALSHPGTAEYAKAIDDIRKNIQGMFETPIDNDFVIQHLNDIKEAADGSVDKMIKLKRAAADFAAQHLDIPAADLKWFRNELQNLNGFTVAPGLDLNDQPFLDRLANLIATAQIDVAQLDKIFSGIGYEFEVTGTKQIPVVSSNVTYDSKGNPHGYATSKLIEVPIIELKSLGDTSFTSFTPSNPTTTSTSGGRGRGGGGSSEKKEEPYENSFDKYYNLTEDINEELRARNKLEEEYNDLIKNSDTSAKDILKNLSKQESSLKRQKKYQEMMQSRRRQQLTTTMNENSDLKKYAKYNFKDMTIEIDWNAINSVKDADKGKRIEDYVSKLEEIQSQMDEADDALDEIDNTLEEIRDRGKDEFLNLEQKVMDAVVNKYQQQIDALNNINTSINTTNAQLMQAVQDTLAQQRLDDQNAETEQNLADMQRRLDYLKQDTSNANVLEIKQLEKSLEDAQEDYTNALIDQKLTEIEDQNQKAAEAREKQIQIAQSQLDTAQKTGELWEEVEDLLLNGTDSSGSLIKGSTLSKILKKNENWSGLSDIGKKEWFDDLEKLIAQGFAWIGKLKPSDDTPFSKALKEKLGISTGGGGKDKDKEKNPSRPGGKGDKKPDLSVGSRVTVKASRKWYEDSYGGGERGYSKSQKQVRITHVNHRGSYPYHVATLDGNPLGWLRKEDLVGYKTGGVADFTGPAWLDGTKSRPEIILNQKDSENFIKLKDILADIFKHNSNDSENTGENYYDIDINIEKVGSQEDIDNIINQIERRITSVARYRNVNNLSIKR